MNWLAIYLIVALFVGGMAREKLRDDENFGIFSYIFIGIVWPVTLPVRLGVSFERVIP